MFPRMHVQALSVAVCLSHCVSVGLCAGVRELKRITNGDCWIAVAHGSSQVQRDESNVARAAAVH
jgi:hypothetical protein